MTKVCCCNLWSKYTNGLSTERTIDGPFRWRLLAGKNNGQKPNCLSSTSDFQSLILTLVATFFGKAKTSSFNISHFSRSFNPIRPGGGGLRGPDDQTHSWKAKASYSMMPKFGDLVFILKTRSDQIIAKLINLGVLLLCSHWYVPKILKMKKFSSAWKLLKLTWGGLNLGR